MTEQFKTTAEYRHWMVRHDLEDYQSSELEALIKSALPHQEHGTWDLVCTRYAQRDFPRWFNKEVGELNDY